MNGTQPTVVRYIVTGKPSKTRWYEVLVYWSDTNDDGEIVAKFRAPGDAQLYALDLASRPMYMADIVVR